jgi:hypothetical protein
MIERRIFISATMDKSLDERRRQLKAAIVAKLVSRNYAPQMFFEAGLAATLAWNFDKVDEMMRRCVGAIVLGFPRWTTTAGPPIVGEYNHYEGAVAIGCHIPLLLVAESGVMNRGVVWNGAGRAVTYVPDDATPEWLEGAYFKSRFDAWVKDVESRDDVFLGYCSQNEGTAAIIETRLRRWGAKVRNYKMDFRAGRSILDELESAARSCSCGIFLFGNNDPLEGLEGAAAPRDNVVFEAGYFMNSKGPDRCLIIREGKAKMPADLGGAIYLPIEGSDVAPIETRLRDFLEKNV